MQNEIDAILFDNDGVLVDTEPLFLQANRELLATLAIEIDLEVYREVSLVQGRSIFDLASDRGASAEEIQALRQRRNDRYADLIEEGVTVFPAVAEVLASLHGRVPLAIVTSSYRPHFEQTHRQTGFLRYFEFSLASGDYGRHKPHPEPYLTAAERLGVAPERCLVIEDSARGLQAAVAAGMRCIAVPTELTATSDFSAAEHVLESLADFLPIYGT